MMALLPQVSPLYHVPQQARSSSCGVADAVVEACSGFPVARFAASPSFFYAFQELDTFPLPSILPSFGDGLF